LHAEDALTATRFIAVDWSGARAVATQRATIWTAEAREEAVDASAGRTREEIAQYLLAEADRDPALVVGFDFAFSLPGWYLAESRIASVRDLWARLSAEHLTPRMRELGLPDWLNDPDPPFWTERRPHDLSGREYRVTERECRPAKSVFQLVGAGQVGRGSLYGMQVLHELVGHGFHVWPFERAALPLAIEIYPRLFVSEARLDGENEHERDATVSALALARAGNEIMELAAEPSYGLEGRIWRPNAAYPRAGGPG
jgi:hypothetical protein